MAIFHSFYPVNDRADTYMNPVTLRPLRSEKFFDEAGSERSYHVDYVHSTYHAKVLRTRHGKTRCKYNKPIPGTTHDMVTWFMELRNRGEMEIGDRMSYFIYDGWRLYRLHATVAKREDVYTPIGWFKTYRIDFTRESLKTKRAKGSSPILTVSKPAEPSGSLWVSRDENFIPIKVAIINNAALGMVRQWQSLFYSERYSASQLPSMQVPDFTMLAQAYGCVGLRCERAEDVDRTIEAAMAVDDQPVVVDFRVSQDAMVWPMVAAGTSNDDVQHARDVRPDFGDDT